MKAPYGKMKMGVLAAAVQGALLAMCAVSSAHAEEPDLAALTKPDNYVEVGVAVTDSKSNKFGEYTGMNDDGAHLIGNFSVKGGDGYGPGEGTRRWSVDGSNLGLDSRELNGSIGDQGKWNVGIGYDELQHNTTTGYQTPYQGAVGGSNFTLPTAFGNTANTTALTPTQSALFQTTDVNNVRRNTSFNAGYTFSPQWRVTFDYNNLEQSGAKLMAFSTDGMVVTNANKEKPAILPNPTDYTTDTYNVALDWTGEHGHLTGAYYASIFKDRNDVVKFANFFGNNTTDWMSTAPQNELHQFNLSGGYRFSPETKLTGGYSYGRNTQDANYVYNVLDTVAGNPFPRNALNGLVVTTHGDAKLVNQTTKDLKLSASVVYNKRDNRTDSNSYEYNHIGVGVYDLANIAYTFEKTAYELAGDYRLGKNNTIRFAYNYDETKRSCDRAANADFPIPNNCLWDTKTTDNKFSLGYRLKATEAVNLSVGYVYSDRNTDYKQGAMVNVDNTAGSTDPLTGVKIATAFGLNGGDYPGFHPLYDASRNEHLFKVGVNWDATDKLSFGVNGRYADDNYTGDQYGAQDGKSWNINLDAAYRYADEGSVFAYISQDYKDRYIKHLTQSTTAAYVWGDQLKDDGVTIGLGFKQGGLMGGKLDLKGDFTYSDAKSSYSGDYLAWIVGTTTATSCALATNLTCGSAPDIKNKLTQIKLSGTYKVDKQSKVALGYIYQRLSSDDYYYNAYQTGYTATSVLPTNQKSGSYDVNVIAASYIYSFK